MIYKLIDTTSFYQPHEPVAKIVTPGDTSGLTKKAAHSAIDSYIASMLTPKDGKMYLHINAMGAGEYYGSNKNGDYFPEEQLRKYHKSFEEFGYVYRHHVNKDPAKSIGKVIFAIYNEDMHRVELIAEVDKVLGKDILSRLESGDFPFTSMACKTPYDVCSICSNKAHTREEYCEHLTGQLNKLMPDGRKVMALNLATLKFFDISIVIRPADITSSILRKVASAVEPCIGSAEMAEIEGIGGAFIKEAETIKEAAIKKLADIVKQIEGGQVVDASPAMDAILAKVVDVPATKAMSLSKAFGFNQVMNALAEHSISPSIGVIGQLIHTHHNPESKDEVAGIINNSIGDMSINDIPSSSLELLPAVSLEKAMPSVLAAVHDLSPGSSLEIDDVEKRASYWDLVNNLHQIPTLASVPQPDAKSTNTDYIIALIGAALVGKFILSTLSKQKNQLKLVYGNQQVKTASQISVADVLLDGAAIATLRRFKI